MVPKTKKTNRLQQQLCSSLGNHSVRIRKIESLHDLKLYFDYARKDWDSEKGIYSDSHSGSRHCFESLSNCNFRRHRHGCRLYLYIWPVNRTKSVLTATDITTCAFCRGAGRINVVAICRSGDGDGVAVPVKLAALYADAVESGDRGA